MAAIEIEQRGRSGGRRHPVRSRTETTKRESKEGRRVRRALYPEIVTGYWRPKCRSDCDNVPRPCPFVGCRYNLYLDVKPSTGSIKFNFPDLAPHEMKESCSLDVAERGGITLESTGDLLNLTRERVRQIELCGLNTVRTGSKGSCLEEWAPVGPDLALRQRILEAMPYTKFSRVDQLSHQFHISAVAVSDHLKALSRSGLVVRRRFENGRVRWLRLRDDANPDRKLEAVSVNSTVEMLAADNVVKAFPMTLDTLRRELHVKEKLNPERERHMMRKKAKVHEFQRMEKNWPEKSELPTKSQWLEENGRE